MALPTYEQSNQDITEARQRALARLQALRAGRATEQRTPDRMLEQGLVFGPPEAPQAPQPRRPFGDGPVPEPKPRPGSMPPLGAGDIVRGLRSQLSSIGQAMSPQLPKSDPMAFPEGAEPQDPPKPAPPPAPQFYSDERRQEFSQDMDRRRREQQMMGRAAARQGMAEQRAEAAFDFDREAEQAQLGQDAADTKNPSSIGSAIGTVVGQQEGNMRDMDAARSAREKVERYNADVLAYKTRIAEKLTRGEQVDLSDPINRWPQMPDFTSAELNMLNVSYPEEIGDGNAARDQFGEDYIDLFIKNQGLDVTKEDVLADPGLAARYDTWLSDNFGNYEDEDYVGPGKAAENIDQAVEYKPFSSPTSPNRDPRMRRDPRQTGDGQYVDDDGTVNIQTAQGRGEKVPVYGVTDTGGAGYGRRTAGGESLSPEYLDSVFGADEDKKALYYAESAGYDLSDPNMSEAERIGKARKIYADHKARSRSFDVTFDDAAGEDGEWRYTENQDSKDRKFNRQAYGRFYRAVLNDPRAYPDLLGPDGEPDPQEIQSYLERNGIVPTPIDSTRDDLVAHPADVDRVRRQQTRRVQSAMGRGEAWRQQQEMRGSEQNMRDPSINRQMLMRSIQEAEDRGATPGEIARIYEFYGLPGIASQEREMGTVKMATDAQVSAAEAARPAPEDEPPPAKQIRLNNDAAIEPYAKNSQDFSEYGLATRSMGVLLNSERAANDMAPLEGDELKLESASRTSQAWLSTAGGQAEMSAAVVAGHDGMDTFIRSRPAVSELFDLIARRVESKIVDNPWEWLVGSGKDEERSRAFLEEAIASAGLTADFEAVVAQWFEERAAIARGA